MSVYRGLALWWLGQDVQIPLASRSWAMEDILGVPLRGLAGPGASRRWSASS